MIERVEGQLVDTATGEVVPLLTEPEAEALTEAIVVAADGLWQLLFESYHREAWRALGYRSWRAYASERFGMSHSKAYRLLHHAGIVKELEAAGAAPEEPLTEGQTRQLRSGNAADDLAAAQTATGVEAPSGDAIRLHRDPEPEPGPPPNPKPADLVSPSGETGSLERWALALETLTGHIVDGYTAGSDTARASIKRSTRRLADVINTTGTPKPAQRQAEPAPKPGGKKR